MLPRQLKHPVRAIDTHNARPPRQPPDLGQVRPRTCSEVNHTPRSVPRKRLKQSLAHWTDHRAPALRISARV